MILYSLKTCHKCEGTQTSCLRGRALNTAVNVAAALEPFISVSRLHSTYTPWQEKPESRSVGDMLEAYRCCCKWEEVLFRGHTAANSPFSFLILDLQWQRVNPPWCKRQKQSNAYICMCKVFTCLSKLSDL